VPPPARHDRTSKLTRASTSAAASCGRRSSASAPWPVGPFFLQRLKGAADKKQQRAEKCEELIGAVAEHYHWITALRYFTISGQGNQPALSPITKIQAIVGMYFPTFDALALEFDTVSNDYEIWILSRIALSDLPWARRGGNFRDRPC
jgi:hypothetical protein